MILIQSRGMRLGDYVLRRKQDDQLRGLKSVFGESREGDIAPTLTRNFTVISLLCGAGGQDELIDPDQGLVFIGIPPTCRGLRPFNEADLPYGWTGQINEYVAEMAVCWAFDIMTQQEADLFLIQHRPSVIFQYYQDGHFQDLPVFFNGTFWEIMTGGMQ